MNICCTIQEPCFCMAHGYIQPKCCPAEYVWAIQRLVDEFGEAHVRIGWENGYGRIQKAAIARDWNDRIGAILTLKTHEPKPYDINNHPEDLSGFIEQAREFMRGGGQ